MRERASRYTCDYCHQPLKPQAHPYTLRLELFQSVEPSLEISDEDLAGDLGKQLDALIDQMERMDDEAVAEQEKRVYMRHCFTLCPACRHRLARQLEALLPPLE